VRGAAVMPSSYRARVTGNDPLRATGVAGGIPGSGTG
jgi:hypothetical protein